MADRDITEGEALQIIRLTGDESRPVEIVEENLEAIMMHADVRNNPVVVMSVAGAYRTGKSFLLGFFLKYLQSEDSDWLNEDDTIRGFRWRYGPEGVTRGIHIWSVPYLKVDSSGRKVAVLLMDTQGTFQARSTPRENTSIFVLSILISSVQIFNIQRRIQEDQLEHLLFFASYGNLATQRSSAIPNEFHPFQRLIFLVRDWQWPGRHSYGRDGGRIYTDDMLQSYNNQSQEAQDLRQRLSSCFYLIEGFLLPEPSEQVRIHETFDGSISDIGEHFRNYVKDLVEFVLHLPLNNRYTKRIYGVEVRGEELKTYIQEFVQMFQGDQLPKPQTMLENMERMAENKAFNDALLLYERNMNEIFPTDNDGNINVVERDVFMERHNTHLQQALDLYRNRTSFLVLGRDRSGILHRKIKDIFERLKLLVDALLRSRQDRRNMLIAGVLGLAGVGVGVAGGIVAAPAVAEVVSGITAEQIITSITAFTALLNRR